MKHVLIAGLMAVLTIGLFAHCKDESKFAIPCVDKPKVVSTTPENESTGIHSRIVDIEIQYDKNISITHQGAKQLTFHGGQILKAEVRGVSKVLHIRVEISLFDDSCQLTIPQGVVWGPNHQSADAFVLCFTPSKQSYLPVFATQPKAVDLYQRLWSIYGLKIISGTMANVAWNYKSAVEVREWVADYPVINGFDYVHLQPSLSGENWIDYGDISPVKDWVQMGGVVTASWHWNVPCQEPQQFDTAYRVTLPHSFYRKNTDFDANRVMQEGSWEQRIFYDDLKNIADYLLLLHDAGIPILWRPLHEAAGGWFWWGKNATSFRWMWHEMFRYFGTRGLDNLLWVWTSVGEDEDWYPGDEYVDIIGCDVYRKALSEVVTRFEDVQARYPQKMVALSECGTIEPIPEIWEEGACWSWFMPWYNNPKKGTEFTDKTWWTVAKKSTNVLFLSDWNKFLEKDND